VNEEFWPALIAGRLGPVHRLVSYFSFDADWSSWERHPAGEEFVCLLAGEVELHLEKEDGTRDSVVLDAPGAFVLVPPNTWHTGKVRRPAKMLFVTPGEGTENRPA
jgi:quercetin dioxygenase-like cupin family protein